MSKSNTRFSKAILNLSLPLGLCLILQGCSSGKSTTVEGTGNNSAGTSIPVDVSQAAASQTAQNHADCKALGDFYWEIGNVDGKLGAGQVGTSYFADTVIPIASASKFVFGAFVLQLTNGNLTENQKSALRMLSGYHGLNPIRCANSSTVAGCLNPSTVPNFTFTPSEIGMFHYDGAHDQYYATLSAANGGLDIGQYTTAQLNDLVFRTLEINPGFSYAFPLLAGGIQSSAQQFAVFLKAILARKLVMYDFLGADAVCTVPGESCPTAASSPSQVQWHYSYNHWVEDDEKGDGTFSSPGAFGFYPWISKDRTMYGVISRNASNGFASSQCGTRLRKAWITGIPQ